MESALTAKSVAEYALLDDYDPLNPTYGYSSDAVRGNADYIPLPKYLGKCVRAHSVYDEEDYYPEADAHENDYYPIINEPAVYERTYSAGDTMPFRDREGDYNEMVRHYGKEAADKHFSYYYCN